MKLSDVLALTAVEHVNAVAYNDRVTKTYTVTATPDVLDRFERFMRHLEYCAGVGHSTTVGMDIDGDGADSFKIVTPKFNGKLPEATNRRGPFESVPGGDID